MHMFDVETTLPTRPDFSLFDYAAIGKSNRFSLSASGFMFFHQEAADFEGNRRFPLFVSGITQTCEQR